MPADPQTHAIKGAAKAAKSVEDSSVALSIAGSDSGGGAGIQADLKTFTALGVFGTTAITCVTAQNPSAVNGVTKIPPRIVAQQIKMICDAFPVAAAKTGMLYSEDIVRAVARAVKKWRINPLVVDPVMIATSGAQLLREGAISALCTDLFPLATLITPNIFEAEVLAQREIKSLHDMQTAAEAIGRRWKTAVVVKGGHMKGKVLTNVLYDHDIVHSFEYPRVKTTSTHGTGCTFSAAITALLACGYILPEAVEDAGWFTARAVADSIRVGRYNALNP